MQQNPETPAHAGAPRATGPLAGVRVLELAGVGPAPFCGALLADMGADVVRLDRPVASQLGFSSPRQFDFYNRNKRSIVLDLKQPENIATALGLVANAEVLIEGFRPGAAERLGLGPEACMAVNPRLVYGRMTGWGQDGPLALVAGHDLNYLGLTGALHCIGPRGGAPTPPLNLAADLGGGAMYLAVGVLAALLEARGSGRGQVVDAAMVDGVAHLMSAFYAFRQRGIWSLERGDNFIDGGAHFYAVYATKDGKYISVAAIEARFYANLLDVFGLASEKLPAQLDRASWPAMRERFAAIIETRTRDEWTRAVEGIDACVAPVLDLDEAPEDPHIRARNTFVPFDGVAHPAPAPRFQRTPSALRRPAPDVGEHTGEVLREWGGAT
jgi:alpha-methylacyl-CoA racemase